MLSRRLAGRRRLVLLALALALTAGLSGGEAARGQVAGSAIALGVASGDVTATSAVVWSRSGAPATMWVEYGLDPLFADETRFAVTKTSVESDLTGSVRLDGLAPGSTYSYRVSFVNAQREGSWRTSEPRTGTFTTAPAPRSRMPLSIVFSGDLDGGQNCQRPEQGLAIFHQMAALQPTLFIANGDMIYADGGCPARTPDGQPIADGGFPSVLAASVDWTSFTQLREAYFQHWRYNRADPGLQRLLRSTSLIAQWDDHEIANDSGGAWTYWNAATKDRAGYGNLVRAAHEAFFDYTPLDRRADEPDRTYRSFRWGDDLELFVLDGRSYRSRNDLPDSPGNAKTLLGSAQLEWLRAGLTRSTATWKIVSSDVPLSVPTGSESPGFGRDGWANGLATTSPTATGFERELLDLMRSLDRANVANLVFLATDVHFPAELRYAVDADGDGDALEFYEIVAGPLNAGLGTPPRSFDPTLNPTPLYIESGFSNFAYLTLTYDVGGTPVLRADIRGDDGLPRPRSALELRPW